MKQYVPLFEEFEQAQSGQAQERVRINPNQGTGQYPVKETIYEDDEFSIVKFEDNIATNWAVRTKSPLDNVLIIQTSTHNGSSIVQPQSLMNCLCIEDCLKIKYIPSNVIQALHQDLMDTLDGVNPDFNEFTREDSGHWFMK